MPKKPISDSKKAANKRYMDSLARVSLWVTPEEKSLLVDQADAEDKSLNSYIRIKLGLRETAKQTTTAEIVLSGGLDEQKLVTFCKEKGYKYKSYHIASGFEKEERWTAGYLWAEDEHGNEIPIPLTMDELESLRTTQESEQ